MSATGDERPTLDTKKSVQEIQQRKQEEIKQQISTLASKLGTKAGETHTNVYDAEAKLVGFLKDTNRINTTQAKNYSKIQERNNQQLRETINKLSESPSSYVITDKNTGEPRKVLGSDIDKMKQTLLDGQVNLVLLNTAAEIGEANKPKYNQIIRQLEEESIKPHLKEPITYKTSPKTLPRKTEPTTIEEKKGILGIISEYTAKKERFERIADYKTEIGLDELRGPDSEKYVNKLKARFAHMSMATAEAYGKGVPLVVLGTVGGAFGATVIGLLGAATAASFINPKNREALDNYVSAHPQEFLATLGGAVLAGVSVVEVRGAFNEYTRNLKLSERRALETKWDEIIDDVSYREQIKGAEYPSNLSKKQLALQRAKARDALEKIINDPSYWEQQKGIKYPSQYVEIPTPNGEKLWFYDIKNPDDRIVYNLVQNSNDKEWILNNFWTEAKAENMALMYDATGYGEMQSITIPELLNQYPELRDPFLNPAFIDPNVLDKAGIVMKGKPDYFNPALLDPNVLNKANIVARAESGLYFNPALAVVLATVTQQGYITKEQILEIINQNEASLEALLEANIQIPVNFADTKLVNLSIAELAQVTEQVSEQDQILALTPLQIQTILIEPIPPIEPTPVEPMPPIIPLIGLPQSKERRGINLRLFNGPEEKYRVKFTYRDKSSQSITVPARSYPEAISKAEMGRRNKLLKETYAERVK